MKMITQNTLAALTNSVAQGGVISVTSGTAWPNFFSTTSQTRYTSANKHLQGEGEREGEGKEEGEGEEYGGELFELEEKGEEKREVRQGEGCGWKEGEWKQEC